MRRSQARRDEAEVSWEFQVAGGVAPHPEALAELYVSLSTHTAPIMEPCYVPLASEQTSEFAIPAWPTLII